MPLGFVGSKIKYSTLNQIFKPFLDKNSLSPLNVSFIIDLESYFRRELNFEFFAKENEMTYISDENIPVMVNNIVADVFNLIGHYRAYLAKACNRTSSFYIVYGLGENNAYLQNLSFSYKGEYINNCASTGAKKIFDNVIESIKMISTLVPATVFVDDSKYYDRLEQAMFVRDAIGKSELLIGIGTDLTLNQICNGYLLTNGDKSIFVESQDTVNILTETPCNFPITALPLVLSISGLNLCIM